MDSTILIYCSKCKRNTKTFNEEPAMSKTDRPMMKGQCVEWNTRKSTFVKMNKNKKENVIFESNSI